MHSRIFQVARKPIKPEDYVTLDDFPTSEYSTPTYYDYVDFSDRESDIEWLSQAFSDVLDVNMENDTIIVKNRNVFVARKLDAIIHSAAELLTCAIDALRSVYVGTADIYDGTHRSKDKSKPKLSSLLWQLNAEYNDKYGFHLYDPSTFGDITLEEWLLDYARNGDVLHIGNTLDFHN